MVKDAKRQEEVQDMAGVREKLGLAQVPDAVKGTALGLLLAGIQSVAFMGFAGLGG